MKFAQTAAAAAALFAATAFAAPVAETDAATVKIWSLVPLEPPFNWIAGPSLFPGNVISGYHADYDEYTPKAWAEHILATCKGISTATSALAYSGINSGTPKTRDWFGYCFRGGATTPANYVRDAGVQNSTAFTLEC